jgi:hypothetical protein
MAMKIGGEYEADKIGPKQIDKLANEAALSGPMVRNRVLELADAVLAALQLATSKKPFAAELAAQIQNCRTTIIIHH